MENRRILFLIWSLLLFGFNAQSQTACQTVVDSFYLAIDINSHIHINTPGDVLLKRDSLINRVWKDGGGLRTTYPTDIFFDIGSWNFIDTTNFPALAQLDQYRVLMPCWYDTTNYTFEAFVQVCHPVNPINKIMIVHEGHTPWEPSGIEQTIDYYLNKGYTILYSNMPVIRNPSPDESIFNSHDNLPVLESATFSPLSLFFDPITRSLNYLLNAGTYDEIDMIGISGGGWTTVLYAAMDTRIKSSYSVAGTYPLFLNDGPCPPTYFPDYEQNVIEVPGSLSYLDLYILCSQGPGRRHVQVVNQFDPCCNGGVQYQVYQEILEDKINCFNNGKYEIFLDSSHSEHKISTVALDYINQTNCVASTLPEGCTR
jgi:hypothetical protein